MRTWKALSVLVVALLAAACTSAAQSATTTSVANPNWYPPIIRTTSAPVVGCIGRKPTGLTSVEATKIIDQVQGLGE